MSGQIRPKPSISEVVVVVTFAGMVFAALLVLISLLLYLIPGIPDWKELPSAKYLAAFALWGILVAWMGIWHGYSEGYKAGSLSRPPGTGPLF